MWVQSTAPMILGKAVTENSEYPAVTDHIRNYLVELLLDMNESSMARKGDKYMHR